MNLNVLINAEYTSELNVDIGSRRITLPMVDEEFTNDTLDHPCRFVKNLSTLINDGTACGINTLLSYINLSNEAITDAIDNLMTDNLMPGWTIRFRDTTVDVFWYRDGVPEEWKTTLPPAGTVRYRCWRIER